MSRFDFKQFTVCQDACAMKVGTDGVLLGAWVPSSHQKDIWDVGTGTGLIALMLAQRSPLAHITAIEINQSAAAQALENVEASPWSNRITVVAGDIRTIAGSLPSPDLIVSNPPFFTNSLLPADSSRSAARHDNTLPLRDLMQLAGRYLSPRGAIAIIIPVDRCYDALTEATMSGLSLNRSVMIRTTPAKPPKRALMQFSRKADAPAYEEQSLHDASGEYSNWYKLITRDFYL